MTASIVAFPTRAIDRIDADCSGLIRWDGWIYEAAIMVDHTPDGLLPLPTGSERISAQDWWHALAERWPGAALDILRTVRAAGYGTEEIRTAHSLAVFNEPADPSLKPRANPNRALPERPKSTASCRAIMELASTLDVEALGELVDQLVGFLWSKHNVAHP